MSRPPYNWAGDKPATAITREVIFEKCLKAIGEGHAAVVLGGRGTGKSVLLRQLEGYLLDGHTAVRLFRHEPVEPTGQALMDELSSKLGLETSFKSPDEIFQKFLSANANIERLVLLYDEVDDYVEINNSYARHFFNSLESIRRNEDGRLSIIVAGGLGLFALRDQLGSDLLSRADKILLEPFTDVEIGELAKPYETELKAPLAEETLEAIRASGGGNPALTTFALQALWNNEDRSPLSVAEAFAGFLDRHYEFIRKARKSLTHRALGEGAAKVRDQVLAATKPIPRAELKVEATADVGTGSLDLRDILQLLQAAGFIKLSSPLNADPVNAHAVASILNFPEESQTKSSLKEQLANDLQSILQRIHRMGPDFFQQKKKVVPEAVFAAVVAIGLAGLGWTFEREALSVSGRTDLKLQRAGFDGFAIAELKIWPRNDAKNIHDQVARYWTTDTRAAATITIDTRKTPGWDQEYQTACFQGIPFDAHAPVPPIAGHFTARSKSPDGFEVEVDHFLLRIASGG